MKPQVRRGGALSDPAVMRYEDAFPRETARQGQGRVRVWDAEAIDALTETVVTRLLVEGIAARAVAMELAARLAVEQPGLPALTLALPFSLAAAAIEEMLGGGPPARSAAADSWRIAALIGADALVLNNRGTGSDTLAGLWAMWQAGDEVFAADPD